METKILLDDKSWVSSFNIPEEIQVNNEIFNSLLSLKPKERGKVIIFGKELDVPRWQQSFGQSYYFSGLEHKAVEITDPYLIKLQKWVENHSGKKYNQILINWYTNGNEYIGPHSDDESQLERNSNIYSFSFGDTRIFKIEAKPNYKDKVKQSQIKISMYHNTCLVMGGEMQKRWKHSVPKKLKKEKEHQIFGNVRINITFRCFKNK